MKQKITTFLHFSLPILAAFFSGNCFLFPDPKKTDNTILLALIASQPQVSTLTLTGLSVPITKPEAIGVLSNGSLILGDTGNNRILRISNESTASVLLDSSSPVGGVTLTSPEGISTKSDGTIFVGNTGAASVFKIDSAGTPTLFAGNGTTGNTSTITTNCFEEAEGLVFESSTGFLYVADPPNNQVVKIDTNGAPSISNRLGSGAPGIVDGAENSANFTDPKGAAVDSQGNLFVSDTGNHAIRKITPSGTVSTFAGSKFQISGSSDGVGNSARFNSPYAITIDPNNNLYLVDSGNQTVRKITPDGVVTTIAGIPGVIGNQDGMASSASFDSPRGIVYHAGALYVTTANPSSSKIRKIQLP
ncbi:hypothetical protein CH373_04380 [Leptospira perolatii]|uniref:SMP-30/Gluconolactonase/LRE-like region domain-containing protein n=2 Tax=Leptospira perolatii TaxID=2023191 RepID=A0A2M9ZQB3_9LEPT|nr:SMP-30/gluconolactonase/LRE family protein [Leptospira perolatii]PJZ74159.1 hypothetical protein CH373_04380 [Leptospira perolatii]